MNEHKTFVVPPALAAAEAEKIVEGERRQRQEIDRIYRHGEPEADLAKLLPSEKQVGGNHYKNLAIQPAVFSEKNKLSGLEASIVKRICRWRNKDGLQDLQKARHEIDLMIEIHFGPDATK